MRLNTSALADAVIEGFAPTLDSFHKRIEALASGAGVVVIDSIDWGRQYPDATLGSHKNGLWIYRLDTATWRCISRSIFDVKVTREADGTTAFAFELSDGTVLKRVAPKAARTTKPVKLLKKPAKPVKLLAK
ncbi:hypothetical protein [Devosia insulae]|uniref:hypothetical protein n=1 Tax=Devosia insulae TaxID=408174 RepID=UPI00114CDC7A|nr:hypothetical protein [Devosia insulae]